jgi:molybdenum cofactor cytidylyltransferase/nicotine blue oxidoreductase
VIVGVVLAAGSGSRMGRPKGELVVGGVRLVDRAVSALHDGGCERVIAVVRPGVQVPSADAVENPDPERGMRSSIELAIEAAADADAVAVLPADMPGVGAAAVRAVLGGWRPGRVALAHYPDGSGHPVVMAPSLWHQALRVAGPDEGARRYLAANEGLVDLVPAAGHASDLDTPADLG